MNKMNEKYSYVTHPNQLPLELKGNFKEYVSSGRKNNGINNNEADQIRSILKEKMLNNIHEFTDNKSVLPGSDRRKKERLNSIRVYKENQHPRNSSGIEYLIAKTENLKVKDHKQRAHINEAIPALQKVNQKKHYDHTPPFMNQLSEKPKKIHRNTNEIRLANDIYSNVGRRQLEAPAAKKMMNNNSLFKNGQQLGFEIRKERIVCKAKIVQIEGYEYLKSKQAPPKIRDRRQDWRTSNIQFF